MQLLNQREMDKEFDIFISYSRKNLDLVKSIKETLEKEIGVRCWMDLNAIESGSPRFSQVLVDGINGCSVFLFMLSEQSQESEYALLELNYARDEAKHVILVNIDDCRLKGAFKLYYGLTDRISWSNQPQREKLFRDLKRWTCDKKREGAEAEVSVSQHVRETAFFKIKTDLDCVFYLDGEEKAKLKAGKLEKIPLREGEYELRFVSLENEKDAVVDYFAMPAFDKLYNVKLMPLREQRLKLEREKQEAAEQARLEQERLAREEAERVRKEKERIAEQARQKAEREREEQERREAAKRAEAERKAKEEAEKRAKQEAERKAKEEAEKRAKQEAERKAKEEAEKRAKEEAARKAKEAEERERKERERKERERQAEEERKKICRAVSDGLVFNVNGVEFKMVKVDGGAFWMGADDGIRTRTVVKKGFFRDKEEQVTYVDKNVRNYDADASDWESPVHSVTLSSYYIGEHQVTVEEFHNFVDATGYKTDAEKEGWAERWMVVDGVWNWNKVNGLNWKYGTNGELRKWSEYRHPVIYVSWNDAVAYCKWLSQKTDTKFGLPTEAQWEFAARGGNLSKGYRFAGSNRIEEVGWYGNIGFGNAEGSTHIVGQKKPNELGIYDMSGNVWEWCNDRYGSYGSGSQTNPQGPSSGSYRVLRGGGWDSRVSNRSRSYSGHRSSESGFRLCCSQ